MRPEGIFRAAGVFGEVGRHWRLDPLVDIVFPIDPGPAILRADGDIGEIVGHQIRAEHVTLVDRGPQFARPGAEVEPVGVSQARAEDPLGPSLEIEFPDQRPVPFGHHILGADVRVRTHRDVEQLVLGMQLEISHPVPPGGRQIHQLARLAGDRGGAQFISIGQHRIVVCNIQRAIAPGQAGGRVEFVDQCFADFGPAVAIGIAQQRDLIGWLSPRPSLTHQQTGDEALDLRADAFVGLHAARLAGQ